MMILRAIFPANTWTAILVSGFVAVWLSRLTSIFVENEKEENDNIRVTAGFPASSVWCHSGPSGERLCKFRNICYDSHFKEFQFRLAEESILSGVQRRELWMNIAMSTVLGHNAFNMKISLFSSPERSPHSSFKFHHMPTFIIHRFKPDNIMHVIHDDVIPLHFTIESMFGKTSFKDKKISLAFSDSYNETTLDVWYNHYSRKNVIKLAAANETICFKDAYIGLHRSTLWFQYGFHQPQGPHFSDNFSVRSLKNYVDYNSLAWKTESSSACTPHVPCLNVVIMIRSVTRRILNLNIILQAIKNAHLKTYPGFRLNIVQVDCAVHNTSYILSHLKKAKLLIGMHGAGMILSIFLPPNAAVVELFPFAINPNHVSFLKALVEQHRSYPLHYEFWRNEVRRYSRPGPQMDPLLGKISHLPQSVRDHIRNLSEVPAVKCCHDPAYLYYIYHDTLVDHKIFHSILRALAATQTRSRLSSVRTEHVFPSLPAFLTCEVTDNIISVKWGDVSNFRENEGLWFQITLLKGGNISIHNVTDSSLYSFILTERITIVPQVWLQPFNKNNVAGLIKYTKCNFKIS